MTLAPSLSKTTPWLYTRQHIFFDTARRPAIITVARTKSLSLAGIRRVEPEIQPDARLASNWASTESWKSSRRCVLTVLCAKFFCRPMQAAATSRYLAICQHAEETIVHKPNQIKLIWSLEILFNPKHLKNATLRRLMFLLWLIGIGTISKLQQ